ncbi:MAG: hypothetical protein IJH61_07645 [Eubacteriaceae bacterium]|nr:hypothetical protein [Eubacteriaceae bacterium]
MSDQSASALGQVIALLGGFLIVAVIIGIILYILASLGLYTMAKNKGLNNPWMTWIPYLRNYKFGEILNDKVSIAGLQIPAARWVMVCAPIVLSLLANIRSDSTAIVTVTGILTIVYYIYLMAANYRLYKLYKPESAVLYTVLTVIFAFLGSIFTFTLRNNEPQEYLDNVQ